MRTYEKLGDVELLQGRYAQARAVYARSLALQRERSLVLSWKVSLACRCEDLGYIWRAQGPHAAARASYERALAVIEGRIERDWRSTSTCCSPRAAWRTCS